MEPLHSTNKLKLRHVVIATTVLVLVGMHAYWRDRGKVEYGSSRETSMSKGKVHTKGHTGRRNGQRSGINNTSIMESTSYDSDGNYTR